jgi:hypothetical protein
MGAVSGRSSLRTSRGGRRRHQSFQVGPRGVTLGQSDVGRERLTRYTYDTPPRVVLGQHATTDEAVYATSTTSSILGSHTRMASGYLLRYPRLRRIRPIRARVLGRLPAAVSTQYGPADATHFTTCYTEGSRPPALNLPTTGYTIRPPSSPSSSSSGDTIPTSQVCPW